MIIPVLIAYDSESAASFSDGEVYDKGLLQEIKEFQSAFAMRLPADLSIYCFYFPMNSKEKLVSEFDRRLGAFI